jgi:DNA-directed RNA polymerase specialized sigma24 family protein
MVEWTVKLEAGDPDGAWDLFVERYRRLIFAAIRHYTTEHDEVMDVFAQVCESLRADDLGRLRRYLTQRDHRARFSTWLVTVVRNLTVDWFRHRDGRQRLSAIAAELPPLQRRIFECVFADGRSHVETYELLAAHEATGLSFGAFLRELRATYRAVAARRKGALMAELWGPPPPPEVEPAVADTLAQGEQAARLSEALESLAPEDRLAIQLFVVDDLPAADVARVVGLPNAKAVYNRVYRALAELRVRLERAGISGVDL